MPDTARSIAATKDIGECKASIEELLKNKGISKTKRSQRSDSRKPEDIRNVRITPELLQARPGLMPHRGGRHPGDMRRQHGEQGAAPSEKHRNRMAYGGIRDAPVLPPARADDPRIVRGRPREEPTRSRGSSEGRFGPRSTSTRWESARSGSIAMSCRRTVGTRTASITGAYVALKDALEALVSQQTLAETPSRRAVAAVSVASLTARFCWI